jgi:hypothetical protein
MFGYDDSLDQRARARVFNIEIEPCIDLVRQTITETKDKIFLFEYDFATGKLSESMLHFASLDKLRNVFMRIHKHQGARVFDQLCNNIANKTPKDVYICVIHRSPRGAVCPSLYRFSNLDSVPIMGEQEAESTMNPLFSDKTLQQAFEDYKKDMFTKEHLKLEDKTYIYILTRREDCILHKKRLCDYLEECKKSLVTKDRIEQISTECNNGNILVFEVVNYLIKYILLIRYSYENDTVKLEYIKSPNDDSDRNPSICLL